MTCRHVGRERAPVIKESLLPTQPSPMTVEDFLAARDREGMREAKWVELDCPDAGGSGRFRHLLVIGVEVERGVVVVTCSFCDTEIQRIAIARRQP